MFWKCWVYRNTWGPKITQSRECLQGWYEVESMISVNTPHTQETLSFRIHSDATTKWTQKSQIQSSLLAYNQSLSHCNKNKGREGAGERISNTSQSLSSHSRPTTSESMQRDPGLKQALSCCCCFKDSPLTHICSWLYMAYHDLSPP